MERATPCLSALRATHAAGALAISVFVGMELFVNAGATEMLALDDRGLTPRASETDGSGGPVQPVPLPWCRSIRPRGAPGGVTNHPIGLTINRVRRSSQRAPASRPYGVLTLDVIDAMTAVAMLKAS